MINVTFLKGIKQGYNASKTFELTESTLRKVSDYDIGMTFCHATEQVPYKHEALCDTLKKRAEFGWFHIYGSPVEGLGQKVRRLKALFPESPTRLLVMDIDKYELPPDIAKQWTDNKPATIASIIRLVLNRLGLTPFSNTNFTFVLSSSQLDRTILSAHLYFFLDKPVGLRDLRRWAMIVNKGLGRTVIDPAVYKSVQPVYISAPVCSNFPDPFPNRIGYSCPGADSFVSIDELKKIGFVMNKLPTPTNIKEGFDSYATTVEKSDQAIKKTWVSTIENLVGTKDRGINEPAHRAAGQMVQEEGSDVIRADLDAYVKTFHNEIWLAIKKHGVRGQQSDIDIYTEDKARSYVESALAKGFGDQADQLGTLVENAINKAAADNSPRPMYMASIKRACLKLKQKHHAKYAEIRVRIKQKLRGLLSVTDYEKTLNVFQIAPGGLPFDCQDTNAVIGHMIRQITWIKSTTDDVYFHIPDPETKLGYELVSTKSPELSLAISSFYISTTKEYPARNVSAQVEAAFRTVAKSGRGMRRKVGQLVGKRIVRSRDTIYYRIGDTAGTDVTAVITTGRVKFAKTDSLPVLWESIDLKPTPVASEAQVKKHLKVDVLTFEKMQYYFEKSLLKYIKCDKESIPALVAISVSLLMRSPLIYSGIFEGPPGSGKTFSASMFKKLFDPEVDDSHIGTDGVQLLPKVFKPDDYAIFDQSEMTIFDNVIALTSTHQSLFSQLSTGSSTKRRILFTQIAEKIKLSQCVILTCLMNPVNQMDFAARTLLVGFNDKQDEPDETKLSTGFVHDAPFIRYCWLALTSVLLGQIQNIRGKSKGGARDSLSTAVSAMFGKVKNPTRTLVSQMDDLSDRKCFTDIISDNVVLMFLAFLDSHTENEIEMTATERWRKFSSWVQHNSINQQDVSLTFILGSKPITHDVAISSLELADVSQRMFDMRMSAAEHRLSQVSEWKADHDRTSLKRTKKYKHKYGNLRSIF